MADQENCVRVTRAAKKRAAAVNAEDQPANKKRVVLGELSNLSNVVVSVNPSLKPESQKPKGKSKTKVKRALVPTKEETKTTKKEDVEPDVDIDEKSDDPQMCGPYVSDIYEYLHKMEVSRRFYLLAVFFSLLFGME